MHYAYFVNKHNRFLATLNVLTLSTNFLLSGRRLHILYMYVNVVYAQYMEGHLGNTATCIYHMSLINRILNINANMNY